ncbi:MAG TPA: enoyl-CoA hydratase/isomerase family protein [Acidimicrobiia bacterium]|nr:enoyl-CoA hydratase/isomerase family protein [Acidimicrobiia bacterium]
MSSSSAFATIAVSASGAVGELVLAQPKRLNPLGAETLEELIDAARWFDQHDDLKVVTVRGEGRVFSAGADVAVFATGSIGSSDPRHAADLGRLMADAIEAMRAVTIAAIHGHCVGGGLVLAAACDLRIAAAGTAFSIPEVDLGIPLAWGGIPRLVREIGPAATKELVMSCRTFDAEEAMQLGFLNRVVPAGALGDAVEELAATLAAKPKQALLATKRHTNAVADGMVSASRSWADADGLLAALQDPEGRAAAAAYLQRMGRNEPR